MRSFKKLCVEGGLGGRVEDLLPPTEEELGAAQPAFLQAIEETRRQLQAGDTSPCVLMYLLFWSRSVLFLEAGSRSALLWKTRPGASYWQVPTLILTHGRRNYIDKKPKCRLYWCLIEFIDLRYSQSCWYFRPSFVNYCPSILTSLPFPPSQSQSPIHTDSVWLGRDVGRWVVLETIFRFSAHLDKCVLMYCSEQVCGSRSALFLEAGSGPALLWKTGSESPH